MTDLLGTDFAFTDDFQIDQQGDFDTLAGLDNVKQAILRRIMTVPGTLLHRPTYGCGLISFQNAPMTLSVKRQLAQRIGEQLPRDPRIAKVVSVAISAPDAQPDNVTIAVTADVVSYGTQTFSFKPFSGVVV